MKSLSTLAWVPLILIGLLGVVSGLSWLFSIEPWLLDQQPNERLLQMSFQALAERAPTVFEYLRILYKFFGLWILGIGLFVITYGATAYRRPEKTSANTLFLSVLGFLLLVQTVFIYSFISDSPFAWVDLIALLLWVAVVIAYVLVEPARKPRAS